MSDPSTEQEAEFQAKKTERYKRYTDSHEALYAALAKSVEVLEGTTSERNFALIEEGKKALELAKEFV